MGLALAGELGRRGIPCIVLERGDGSIAQPKMDLIGIRTMELCRRWGIVEWVEQAGYDRDLDVVALLTEADLRDDLAAFGEQGQQVTVDLVDLGAEVLDAALVGHAAQCRKAPWGPPPPC